MKKILIITDSKSHTEKDDIFYLVEEFRRQNNDIFILDRAVEKNGLFFSAKRQVNLYFHNVKKYKFTFESYKQNYTYTIKTNTFKFDLVLLRIDRPISDIVLQHIEDTFTNTLIVNNPKGIIATASKEFLFNVKDNCPPMKLCETYSDIKDFSSLFPIVIKPLKGYGGKGICRILNNKFYFENQEISENKFKTIIISFLEKEKKLLAVKYLKNVHKGDKRIYVVNGKIIGATNRVPKTDSWIGNVQYGAIVERTTISNDENRIINNINTVLQDSGIYIYGADILIDDEDKPILSEINTLNVGGCRSIDQLYNSGCIRNVVTSLLDLIN